ncbi:MAG: hypothetical protein HY390_03540 [Deltaproteobacteria bacterium]|nr:hypothetical protein [Deltaproteobacteria bacterium]
MQTLKKIGITCLISLFFFQLSSTLLAAKKPTKPSSTQTRHRKDTSKHFGLGAFVGTDVGVGGKYWFKEMQWPLSTQFGTGYDFSGGWMLFADALYQFHDLKVLNFFAPADLHAHAGGGVKVGFFDTHVWIRIPIGADLLYQQNPYGLFVELAPGIRLNPNVGGNFDVMAGFRYFFW